MKFKNVLVAFVAGSICISASAADLAYTETIKKEFAGEYAESASYFVKKGMVQLMVSIDTGFDDCRMRTHHSPEMCRPIRRAELLNIPHLAFDKSIGKRGAIVYKTDDGAVVCAVKKLIGLKRTKDCAIQLVNSRDSIVVNFFVK
jgi:hypothetical protein